MGPPLLSRINPVLERECQRIRPQPNEKCGRLPRELPTLPLPWCLVKRTPEEDVFACFDLDTPARTSGWLPRMEPSAILPYRCMTEDRPGSPSSFPHVPQVRKPRPARSVGRLHKGPILLGEFQEVRVGLITRLVEFRIPRIEGGGSRFLAPIGQGRERCRREGFPKPRLCAVLVYRYVIHLFHLLGDSPELNVMV